MQQTLGQKLRMLRRSRHFTQQQISDHLHLERAAYANYENDRRMPSYQHLVRIADFYSIHIDYLVRPEFSGAVRRRSSRAEQVLEDFCALAPDVQHEIAEYIHYRAAK